MMIYSVRHGRKFIIILGPREGSDTGQGIRGLAAAVEFVLEVECGGGGEARECLHAMRRA